MSNFKQVISRRVFLQKVTIQVLISTTGSPYIKHLTTSDVVKATDEQCLPYGSGPYGQGPYCGATHQKIYFPLIIKEGS
jgi:hypothetical protein